MQPDTRVEFLQRGEQRVEARFVDREVVGVLLELDPESSVPSPIAGIRGSPAARKYPNAGTQESGAGCDADLQKGRVI